MFPVWPLIHSKPLMPDLQIFQIFNILLMLNERLQSSVTTTVSIQTPLHKESIALCIHLMTSPSFTRQRKVCLSQSHVTPLLQILAKCFFSITTRLHLVSGLKPPLDFKKHSDWRMLLFRHECHGSSLWHVFESVPRSATCSSYSRSNGCMYSAKLVLPQHYAYGNCLCLIVSLFWRTVQVDSSSSIWMKILCMRPEHCLQVINRHK
jgi:hypothetical protein